MLPSILQNKLQTGAQSAHSKSADHQRITETIANGNGAGIVNSRQAAPFGPGLEELSGDVAGNFQRFGNGSALSDQARHLLGGRQPDTFRLPFDVQMHDPFHR